MDLAKNWKSYELIDASNGEKLERWGDYFLLRPDPQIIWDNGDLFKKYKNMIHAVYHRSKTGGGYWENLKNIPKSWCVSYKNLTFNVKEMGFKHTGVFPEQAVNWDYMYEKIKGADRKIKVLNLFAYTGGATISCMSAGAHVTHVDSSKGMVDWCKENVLSSKLDSSNVRYIVDDVIKFVRREARRGNKYDAIVMDPPSFGRGANKEVWNIESDLWTLVSECMNIMSEEPLFFLINSYTTGLSSNVLKNILNILMVKRFNGSVSNGEIGIPIGNSDLVLPCGIYARWEN